MALLATALAGGYKWGSDSELASQAREDKVRQVATEAASQAAAGAIAKIKVTNQTILQEVQRETRTNTVYLDCRHSTETFENLNRVLSLTE